MNKLQKRALRKKRHKHQQYMKYEAPLDRLERALANLSGAQARRCPSVDPETGRQCTLPNLHLGMCMENSVGLRTWEINAVAMEGL